MRRSAQGVAAVIMLSFAVAAGWADDDGSGSAPGNQTWPSHGQPMYWGRGAGMMRVDPSAPGGSFGNPPGHQTAVDQANQMAAVARRMMPPSNMPIPIEAAIQGLGIPPDQAQVSQIYARLGAIEDPAEQQRLQQLLNQRLQVLQSMSEAAAAPPNANPAAGFYHHPEPEPLAGDLAPQVETAVVGPNASVEDLRAVDRLVQAIARIEDPVRRDELLSRLEQREREAEQAAAAFNPAAPMPAPPEQAGWEQPQ